MSQQLETPAAVEAAKADYIATGEPEAFVRYEAALREWLRDPPRVGSWAWHFERARAGRKRPPDGGASPAPCAAPLPPAPPAPTAHADTLVAAE